MSGSIHVSLVNFVPLPPSCANLYHLDQTHPIFGHYPSSRFFVKFNSRNLPILECRYYRASVSQVASLSLSWLSCCSHSHLTPQLPLPPPPCDFVARRCASLVHLEMGSNPSWSAQSHRRAIRLAQDWVCWCLVRRLLIRVDQKCSKICIKCG